MLSMKILNTIAAISVSTLGLNATNLINTHNDLDSSSYAYNIGSIQSSKNYIDTSDLLSCSPEDHVYSLIDWDQRKLSENNIFDCDDLLNPTLEDHIYDLIDRKQNMQLSSNIVNNNHLALISE